MCPPRWGQQGWRRTRAGSPKVDISPGAYDRPARPGQRGFGSQEGRTRGHAGTAGPQDSRRGQLNHRRLPRGSGLELGHLLPPCRPSEATGPESLYQRRQEISGAFVSLLSQAWARWPRRGSGGGWQRQGLTPAAPLTAVSPAQLAATQCGAKRLSRGPCLLSSGLASKDAGAGWPQPNRAGATIGEAKLVPQLL